MHMQHFLFHWRGHRNAHLVDDPQNWSREVAADFFFSFSSWLLRPVRLREREWPASQFVPKYDGSSFRYGLTPRNIYLIHLCFPASVSLASCFVYIVCWLWTALNLFIFLVGQMGILRVRAVSCTLFLFVSSSQFPLCAFWLYSEMIKMWKEKLYILRARAM